MSYSLDLRERVVAYVEAGSSVRKAEEVFKVGKTTVHSWVVKKNTTGSLAPKELNRPFKKIDPQVLRKLIEAKPDMYLRELAEQFNCTTGSISQALCKLNITRKKRVRPTEKRVPLSKRSLSKRS